MKYTKLLLTFVNIFYYLGIVAFIVIPIAGIYLLTQVYNDGFKNEDKIFVEIGYDYILKIIAQYLLYFIPLICLFYFRKTLTLFVNLKVFHTDVINLFYKMGKYLIVFAIGKTLVLWLPISYTYLTIKENNFTQHNIYTNNFTLNFIDFIWIAIGLFFIVLSEIFKKAKELKQENDLTI